jgi:hypothetical protein
MNRTRQGNSILDNVRAAVSDRPNVRCLNLCAAATVYDSNAGNGACVLVRGAHCAPEVCVPNLTVEQDLFDPAHLLDKRCI